MAPKRVGNWAEAQFSVQQANTPTICILLVLECARVCRSGEEEWDHRGPVSQECTNFWCRQTLTHVFSGGVVKHSDGVTTK